MMKLPLPQLLKQLRENFPKLSVIITFSTYAFGSLLLRGISIIILPLIMRQLTPTDYGILSLITAFHTIGTAILGLGLRQVLSLEYFHHKDAEKKHLITELLLLYTLIAIPSILFFWPFRLFLISYLFFDGITVIQLLPVVINLFLFFYAELFYQLLQYAQQARLLTFLQIAIALLTSGASLYAVWHLHAGITGILWAQCIGQLCASSIAGIYFLTHIYIHSVAKKATKKLGYYLRYGAPFIPGIICSWVLASSDRWMLGYYCNMEEVGIYAVADLFAQIFNSMILVPWSGSYLPYIMKRYKKNESSLHIIEQQNQRTMWMSLWLLAAMIIIGFVLSKPLLYWILPATYHNALSYVPILLFGQLFLLGNYFVSSFIQFKKCTFFLAIALAIPALLNITLNALLIPLCSIYGASVATLISYGIYFMITYHYNTILLKQGSHEAPSAPATSFEYCHRNTTSR